MYDLRHRDRQPELMDQPGLDERLHQRALAGLKRVNFFSRTADVVFREIQRLAAARDKPLRVLDIATGGGDVAIGLAKRAGRHGISLEVDGCDISSTAIGLAQAAALAAGVPNVKFMVHDVLERELPAGYDVTMCTLFLHHLSENDTITVLTRMAAACSRAVVVDDLARTRWGYLLAWGGSRLLSRSPIVHTDGPLSVRAAYSSEELRELAEQAGLKQAGFRHHWPQRFTMTWNKPGCRET